MADRYPQRLYRSRAHRMLGGVAGGLGEYFDVDPVLMRLAFVAGTLLTGGGVLLLYLVLWIIIPAEGAEPAGRSATWRRNADEIVGEARRLGTDIRETVRPGRGAGVAGPPGREAAAGPTPPEGVPEPTPSPAEEPVQPAAPSGATSEPQATYRYVESYRREGVHRRRQSWAGLILIVLGLWWLANNFRLLWWVRGDLLWPLIFVGVGAWLLLRQRRDRWG